MELDGIPAWDGLSELGPTRVTWRGDSIAEVVSTPAARWNDLAVIPGLIDTHVHLVGYAGTGTVDFATWPLTTTREEQVLHGVAHAKRALRRGVTTLRDLAGDDAQIAIRRAFAGRVLTGPRVLVHAVVGMTAGHCDLFTPAAVTGRPPTADGPWECRRLVRAWARAGADGIKITTGGGVLSTGDRSSWRNHTREEVRAIVDEAHALGMQVAAHAHDRSAIQVAIEEGADSIEHATTISHEQAELVAANRTPVAPTLLINDAIATARVPVSPEAQAKAAELVTERDSLMRYGAIAGVNFVLGTDANGYHVDFGDEMAELARMHEVIGLDAESCLRAATSKAAAAIGLDATIGRLAPGYSADLLIVRGRPWRDIRDLTVDNLVAVVARGEVVAGALPAQ